MAIASVASTEVNTCDSTRPRRWRPIVRVLTIGVGRLGSKRFDGHRGDKAAVILLDGPHPRFLQTRACEDALPVALHADHDPTFLLRLAVKRLRERPDF